MYDYSDYCCCQKYGSRQALMYLCISLYLLISSHGWSSLIGKSPKNDPIDNPIADHPPAPAPRPHSSHAALSIPLPRNPVSKLHQILHSLCLFRVPVDIPPVHLDHRSVHTGVVGLVGFIGIIGRRHKVALGEILREESQPYGAELAIIFNISVLSKVLEGTE